MRQSFHFGHPAVQLAAPENSRIAAALLGTGQRLATVAGSVLPMRGTRRLSSERGFLAEIAPPA
jgi:hypothetical protein